jgi:hypothetical protein
MATNREVSEAPRRLAESVERSNAATIAAQSWNQGDMRSLSLQSNSSIPSEFGGLELFSDSQPVCVAKVDATLDRKTGTLTVTELDGNEKHKKGETLTVPNVVSGNGEYAAPGGGSDGKYDNLKDHGPIPKGDYLVGNSYKNASILRDHPDGDASWYPLYGSDGKGGYSNQQLWNDRGGLFMHTGRQSNGCVTFWADQTGSDANYPHSQNYDKMKEFLDSTKPYEYKPGDKYRGFLHVK